MPSPFVFCIHFSSLSIYKQNNVGEGGHPYLTPMSLPKHLDMPSFVLILPLAFS